MISEYYKDQRKKKQPISGELKFREAYLRATREVLDNWGFESFAIEQLRGMLELAEKFQQVNDE